MNPSEVHAVWSDVRRKETSSSFPEDKSAIGQGYGAAAAGVNLDSDLCILASRSAAQTGAAALQELLVDPDMNKNSIAELSTNLVSVVAVGSLV